MGKNEKGCKKMKKNVKNEKECNYMIYPLQNA